MDQVFKCITANEIYTGVSAGGSQTSFTVKNFTTGATIASLGQDANENGKFFLYDSSGSIKIGFVAGTNTLSYVNTVSGLCVGSASMDASVKLGVSSTTKGFLPPVMTSAQRGAIGTPTVGLMVFDSDLQQICVYVTGKWQKCTQTDC